MRRLAVALLIAAACALGGPAHAQNSPAPTTAPAPAHGRPWGRLAIFIPASALIGAGVVVGRRTSVARGWLSR